MSYVEDIQLSLALSFCLVLAHEEVNISHPQAHQAASSKSTYLAILSKQMPIISSISLLPVTGASDYFRDTSRESRNIREPSIMRDSMQ